MSVLSQVVSTSTSAAGNTKLPRFRCRKIRFTLNNYTEIEMSQIKEYFLNNKNIDKYIFGEEIAPTTGTPHLQGYCTFKNQKDFSALCKECPGFIRASIFNADKGDIANFNYCSKDGKYITNIERPINMEDYIIKDLYPWQKYIENIILEKPDKRAIHWIYNPEGCVGKSEFVKYCVVKHKAIFTKGGKKNDIINLVFNNKKHFTNSTNSTIFWDLPKSIKAEYISYDSIEEVKDGLISNNKFEAGCFVCPPPHVIIMGNCLPNTKSLIKDRWNIYTIKNLEIVKLSLDWVESHYFDDDH